MRFFEHLSLTLVVCLATGSLGCSPSGGPEATLPVSQPPDVQESEQASFVVKDLSTFKVMLERTTCFGSCPSYFVEVTGDGHVRYCGGAHVKEAGVRTKTIPAASVQALAESFSRAGFSELQDEYIGGVDGYGQILRLSHDGQTKRVFEMLGEYAGVPKRVRELGQAIDDLAGTKEWIGDPAANANGDWEMCYNLARGITG
jgi:Domain of unknown function (DUF6438)